MAAPSTKAAGLLSGLCGILLFCGCASAQTAPATSPSDRALADECDRLIAHAVRRPYGWAWPALLVATDEHPNAPVAVATADSAAAGLLLLEAGEFLDNADYRQAALQAARGASAAQQANGHVPPRTVFAALAGQKPEQALVAQRGPTFAVLGLELSVLHALPQRDELVDRRTRTAALWIMHQQDTTGAWPQAWPPAAAARDSFRVVRFDDGDYRNCVLTMQLANDVLADPAFGRSAASGLEFILRARLDDSARRGAHLWTGAYMPDGSICTRIPELPPAVDLLASRYAMQTLLAGRLILGDGAAGLALPDSATAALGLRNADGTWYRFFDPYHPLPTAPPPASAPWPTSRPTTNPFLTPGDFGLPTLLDASAQLRKIGRGDYLKGMTQPFDWRQHIAHALCGLDDLALIDDFPSTAEQAKAYLKAHRADWDQLDADPPTSLDATVHRLWLLLLRARCQRLL